MWRLAADLSDKDCSFLTQLEAQRATLVRVRTSARSLSDIKRGLSERRLFRQGSSRARGGQDWLKKWKKEDIRDGDWECPG